MTDEEMAAGHLTDEQLMGGGAPAPSGPRDMGPSARRAMAGKSPGPRETPDEVTPNDLKGPPEAMVSFPGPETESGRPPVWTNNPSESGDPILAGITQEAMGRGIIGGGLGLLGQAVRKGVSGTAGGRARSFLDEAGAPVSPPKGEFGQPVKPQGAFNPEAPVSGGTFEGMQAGKAIDSLERMKSRLPAGQAAELDKEIARIRASSSEAADPRIAEAQDALRFKVPHGGHGVATVAHALYGNPIALAALAAKNAGPTAGRVLMDAPKLEAVGRSGLPLLLQAALGNRSDGQQ